MVSEEVLSEINDKLADTSTIICCAYCKLYTNDGKSSHWRPSLLSGALVLLVERSLQSFLLRLYDINKFDMTFETELYYNFVSFYSKLSNDFYSFPVVGGQLGLSFSDSGAAKEFYKCISLYSPEESSHSRKSSHKLAVQKSHWMQQLKSKLLNTKNEDSKDKIEISKPYAVQLVSRVEWDEVNGCYILDSLPVELRRIFSADSKLRNGDSSVNSGSMRSKMNSVDNSHRSTRNQTLRNTLANKNTKVSSFAELEEQVLGSKQTAEGVFSSKPPAQAYYNILAVKIAERKRELDKYHIDEEMSESSKE